LGGENMALQFITDEKNNKVAVILPIEEYKRICEELEELEAIRAYDAAKASEDEVIPFEQAIKEIEKG
jgi:PHD/YefM family antitoxin component YafN of YafNO toxin-antitoxin module